MEFTWYEVRPRGTAKKAVPAWSLRCALDDSGELWIPAVLVGGEDQTLLCCSFDGIPFFVDDHHAYIPATWACRERPDLIEVVNRTRAAIGATDSINH